MVQGLGLKWRAEGIAAARERSAHRDRPLGGVPRSEKQFFAAA
jgi:hypothetical protein